MIYEVSKQKEKYIYKKKGKADGEAQAKHATQFAFIEGDNGTNT